MVVHSSAPIRCSLLQQLWSASASQVLIIAARLSPGRAPPGARAKVARVGQARTIRAAATPSDLMSCGRERETAPRSSHHVARGWQQEKRSRIMHSTWSHVEHAEPAQKCAYTRQNAHHSTHGGRRCSVQVASHGRGQRGSLGPAHVDGAFVKVGEVRARLAAFVAALRSAQPPPLPA